MPTSARKLAPKTIAATTAATATVVPTRALRTGTAVRPWPGSNAIRTPRAAGTEPPSPSAGPSRDRCRGAAGSASPSAPGARAAARSAAGTIAISGTPAMTAKPAPRMARLTSIPGLGSASRAGPIGISGDAAMATPTAMAPPAMRHDGHPGQGQGGQR